MTALPPDPQNPYRSFLVQASAGSGKTYQLSRRFLFLVGAGADPASILTITFTKKAAAEMRERILAEASRLIRDPSARSAFDATLRRYHDEAHRHGAGHRGDDGPPARLAPPRGAVEAGRAILAATQLLRVTTIDSIFMDWLRKFPWEASDVASRDHFPLPARFRVPSTYENDEIDREAWRRLTEELIQATVGAGERFAGIGGLDLMAIKTRLSELGKNRSYLWLASELRRQASGDASAFNQHPLPRHERIAFPATEAELIGACEAELMALAASIAAPSRREALRQAIARRDVTALRELKLLKADLSVHRGTIRGAKSADFCREIEAVDELMTAHAAHERLSLLNQIGRALETLYHRYSDLRDHHKFRQGFVEFDDTARGAYRLFTSDEALGARYLIHKRTHHVMIDEFQDTSRLQWAIFESICHEILAGFGLETAQGGPPPSVFLVGDEKQSIYGFREADARILGEAADMLGELGVARVPLNRSFRTSQVVLDFVNEAFGDLMVDFPRHETAELEGRPVTPDHGRIIVAPVFEGDPSGELEPVVAEARFIAETLAEALRGDEPLAVYDKTLGAYRALEPQDCAILYRAATHAGVIEEELRAVGLEGRREEGRGFFTRPEVVDLVALIRFLAYPSDLLSLATVLKSPIGGLSDRRVLELLADAGEAEPRREGRVRYLLARLASEHPGIGKPLVRLVSEAGRSLPHEILLDALSVWAICARYETAFAADDGALAKANIQQFFELVVELEAAGHRDLVSLVAELEALRAQDDRGNAPTGRQAITLMTIHKSKGLEYPLVAVVGSAEPWEKKDPYWAKATSKAEGAGIYYIGTSSDRPRGDASFLRLSTAIEDEAVRENIRLLYVALTRSRQYLLVTGSRRKPSREATFHDALSAAAERCGAAARVVAGRPCLVLSREAPVTLAPPRRPASEQAILSRPPRTAASVTAWPAEIATVAPHRLLARGDERLDLSELGKSHGSLGQVIGTFVHRGLEAHVKGEPFAARAHWQWLLGRLAPFEAPYAPEESDAAFAEACEALERTVADSVWRGLWQDAAVVAAERPIVFLRGHELIRGTIDLYVESSSGDALIVDYKTTRQVTAVADDDGLLRFVHSHGYGAQLGAYLTAIRSLGKGAVRGAIYFTAINRLVELPNSLN